MFHFKIPSGNLTQLWNMTIEIIVFLHWRNGGNGGSFLFCLRTFTRGSNSIFNDFQVTGQICGRFLERGDPIVMGTPRPLVIQHNYGKSHCLLGKLWKISIFNGKTMENPHFWWENHGKSHVLMGKLYISTGPFSIATFNYQRVLHCDDLGCNNDWGKLQMLMSSTIG